MRSVRRRFWVESGLTIVTGVLFLVTAAWPDWVERLTAARPDAGDGSLEWMLVGTLAVATVALGLVARAEWVRAGRPATP